MIQRSVAEVLDRLGFGYDFLGEHPMRARAFTNAARTLKKLPDVATAFAAGELDALPGIGPGVLDVVARVVRGEPVPAHVSALEARAADAGATLGPVGLYRGSERVPCPEEMTARMVNAASQPYADVIGHLTGGLILGRAGGRRPRPRRGERPAAARRLRTRPRALRPAAPRAHGSPHPRPHRRQPRRAGPRG